MKVILLQNIKNFGQIGDVKNVSDGYGKNFLLPRGMAKLATPDSLKEVDNLKKRLAVVLEAEQKNAQEIANKLNGVTLDITVKANKTGKLFAAVGKEDLAARIKETFQVKVDEDSIDLKEPIKKTGEYDITLELAPGTSTQLKVVVKGE